MQHYLARILVLAFCCLLGSTNLVSAADPQDLSLTVLRDGDPIGTQKYSFSKDGDKVMVNSSMHTQVKKLGITVYRHDFDGQEVWQNGQLVSFKSKTHDNGDDWDLAMQKQGDALQVNCNGQTTTVPADAMIVSLWNKDVLQKNELLSSLNGKPYKNLAVRDAGQEMITIKGQSVPAQHYVMTGDLERDLWYDQDGRLLKVAFDKNGSKIEYVRE